VPHFVPTLHQKPSQSVAMGEIENRPYGPVESTSQLIIALGRKDERRNC
jgi:hypothetical protein